ncbi:MAG TPA: fumarylacetoacetate hydrolase family protein [Caulobacteraceae bacterium]|nr:fumarylacetoacetate hydrolase family protein [Caulobacteraceae bacterium]
MQVAAREVLPEDWVDAVLVGRLWFGGGPIPVVFRNGDLYEISELAPTLSHLFDLPDPAAQVLACRGVRRGSLEGHLLGDALLAPCDLQAIKAAGVTFADSLVERVIEERAKGDPQAAERLRTELGGLLGGSLTGLEPGSDAAMQLKTALIERGLWSQYLEVGIGPDAEIFTKAQPMSAVGCGAQIGLHPNSAWNNPEPEVVLAVSSRGDIVGASLGNDVNLRDFEGRSALLLSKAKDNNASCAVGPFVRLFDQRFTLDDVRQADVHLRVEGPDQFVVEGVNSMLRISRDPADLVAATLGPYHQYPDGLMLFLGTMFVPTKDRMGPGEGFTHVDGDIVRVASPKLGALVNAVTTSDRAPPWTFGVKALMAWLAARGDLGGKPA